MAAEQPVSVELSEEDALAETQAPLSAAEAEALAETVHEEINSLCGPCLPPQQRSTLAAGVTALLRAGLFVLDNLMHIFGVVSCENGGH